ncbi:response regulator [Alkalinema sp. FACHB-956]|uniref:response regulator n=1 Tax=Alkalinema sp. FACHB-956 TaxID=2692768 RepID=UPI001682B098|nr:hybrid sensor histidine kinase/response regulator [Alkalinema sp. FACHB-956]
MITATVTQTICILLVDDNPTNLKVLSEAIQGNSWKALMATDGESAIEQAEYAHPDLILLDVMMPGIDGFETCRRLKINPLTQDIPIIFMTALSETMDKVRGLELGAVDYITKPFQQEEVIARLKLHLQISQLTHTLEQRVQERTAELSQSLAQLQQAQVQLVQSEKMSMLGQLVAGIGHEINNPIGFIRGNITPMQDYIQDLFDLIHLYQEKFPDPGTEILDLAEMIDIDYLAEDLPKIMRSMEQGVDRLQEISLSLRTFARADIASKIEFSLHEGIDSTIMLLRHRLKANEKRPEIVIVKQFEPVPPISCHPGQLNQVFMNIIANAIDAFDDLNQNRSYKEIEACPNVITITITLDESKKNAVVRIQDNGMGIPAELQNQIFEASFTTKAVGKGTGLGLAISHQIIVDKHHGQLHCVTKPNVGTEFIITLPVV